MGLVGTVFTLLLPECQEGSGGAELLSSACSSNVIMCHLSFLSSLVSAQHSGELKLFPYFYRKGTSEQRWEQNFH